MKMHFVFFLFCVITFCASLSFVALSGPSIGIAVPTVPASGWGDFNRDGYLDLATCGNANTGIYINNRNETFTVIPGVTLNSIGNCFVSVGDINNDNWPDIVYNNNGPAVILINNQNNTFTISSGPLTSNNQHRLIDVNNDGKQDFMAFRRGCTSGVFRNNGNNTFTLDFALSLLFLIPLEIYWM